MNRTDVKLRAGDSVEGISEPEIGELSLRMGTAPSEFDVSESAGVVEAVTLDLVSTKPGPAHGVLLSFAAVPFEFLSIG